MTTLVEIQNQKKYMTDKGDLHSYLEVYDNIFAPLQDKPIKLLEIGIWRWGSIKLWNDYFTHPQREIHGIEINDIGQLKVPFMYKGDIKTWTPPMEFDIIIDDGSHILEEQKIAYQRLFPYCKSLYFIEDIQTLEGAIELQSLGFSTLYDLRYKKNRYDDLLLAYRR